MLKRPCHFYNTVGKCHFGKHCKFLHDIVFKPEQAGQSPQDEAVKDPDSAVVEPQVSIISENSSENNENGSLSQDNQTSPPSVPTESNICKFYAKTRFCRYGKRCRYQHVQVAKQPPRDLKSFNELKESKNQDVEQNKVQNEGQVAVVAEIKGDELATSRLPKSAKAADKSTNQRRPVKVCHFFKQGGCRFGKRCRYFHPKDVFNLEEDLNKIEIKSEKADQLEVKTANSQTSRPPSRPQQIIHVYKRNEINKEKISELKETEIKQLKRRFPADKLRIVEETDHSAEFIFTFSPTDPDWPYDVRTFDIGVQFPEEYPLKLFTVDLPIEQDLPETVRRYVEVSLQEWVSKKGEEYETKDTVELLFRPFLRWLDKNMEDIVTEGLKQLRRELTAKAAGMQFISAKELQKNRNDPSPGDADQSKLSDDPDQFQNAPEEMEEELQPIIYRKSDNTAEEVYLGPSKADVQTSDEDTSDDDADDDGNVAEKENKEHQRPQITLDTERRGTELSFRNMQMWFITTVMVEKLRLTVQCDRCKNQTDFTTPPNRVNSVACSKCNNTQLVVFRPVLAHSYSSTFGYLDLDGCHAFDLILQDCHFSVGCIVCSRDVLVKSLVPGQQLEMWCRGCHNKMKFAADSVKITKLGGSEVNPSHFSGTIHQVNVKRIGRVINPAIQEGKPLPDNGACKHYKKSFRWLRFPCCGKCYPCDVCHDDEEDHEMKYANRMICGFCCREQPYAGDKPCLGCSSALTKVRSSHWEGGRGCRDKISMSRNDDKKFANMNKTMSTKAQTLKDKNKSKKNTKLRHA